MWEIPIKIMSNRHLVNQAHAHQVGDKWKEMKANLWQNDPAKASGKAIIWETNEKKSKQTFGKMIRPRHPAKQSSGRQMKRNESKPLAKWSGQGIQQSNHLGDKWKETKANLWQNDPAKASSKAIIWDKWKEMKANLCQPRHPSSKGSANPDPSTHQTTPPDLRTLTPILEVRTPIAKGIWGIKRSGPKSSPCVK